MAMLGANVAARVPLGRGTSTSGVWPGFSFQAILRQSSLQQNNRCWWCVPGTRLVAPSDEASLRELSGVRQFSGEGKFAGHRPQHVHVEPDDPQRVVGQLHVDHAEIQIDVWREAS